MTKREIMDRVIKALQGDLPVVSRPYLLVAEDIGLTEQEVISAAAELKERGLLKRVGAVLRHQQVGYKANAMVAWKVAEEAMDEVGNLMAMSPLVSHCYWRQTPAGWPFNLFTMIHARHNDELLSVIRKLSSMTGVEEYRVIESVRELKKTSVQYR
ncbi:MAG: Lrp/AsnC family transcriptional regulator [Syntrophomonadales bacterium]|jgi:DNA-binding Lrp family transcriptional regulator